MIPPARFKPPVRAAVWPEAAVAPPGELTTCLSGDSSHARIYLHKGKPHPGPDADAVPLTPAPGAGRDSPAGPLLHNLQ